MPLPPQPLHYRFNRKLAELYADFKGVPTPAALAELAGSLVDSGVTVLGHRSPSQAHAMKWWPCDFDLLKHDDAYEAHVHLHPVRSHFRKTGASGPLLLSDLEPSVKFKNGPLYHDYFRHQSITRMMVLYVPISAGSHFSLGVGRDGRDFSGEDRNLFACLHPHLFAAVQRDLTQNIPELRAEGGAPATGGACLTERESEILRWIAAGKNNPDIAVILGLSRYTVKTHVERILAKLGVDNRLAAVSIAQAWRI
ncbi:MAG: helix-turn-helix transcriptional regulator [Undibacterium sp.]|nr:helix-turn-helix transcriptional regulator [Opitutaceae bacterium]